MGIQPDQRDQCDQQNIKINKARKRLTYKIWFISLVIGVSAWTIVSSLSIPYANQIQQKLFFNTHGIGIPVIAHDPISAIHVGVQPHTIPTRKTSALPTPTPRMQTTPSMPGTPIPSPVPATPTATPSNGISPLIFGTNLGLFDTYDQVLTSVSTQTLLQQMHTHIIRMPLRTNLTEATEIQAAQVIKSLGAIPLIVLNGSMIPNALANDIIIVNDMNRIFGNSIVYYEYGNEEDLAGVSVSSYTASWNNVVPQLKRTAWNGHFIGPVNYQYDSAYLTTFLQTANPLPNEISWHEYTCDDSWSSSICIANIANWNGDIQDAHSVMMNTIHTTLPIMITEWNYSPNAHPNDGKNNDSAFMNTWTSQALQTLAANHVFASMQYSCTNTAIPMVDSSGASTIQGTTFKTLYETIIGTQ